MGRRQIRTGRRQTCQGLLSLAVGAGACESTSTPGDLGDDGAPDNEPLEVETLPPPALEGTVSLEATLAARRSIRGWTEEPLTRDQLGQLLWAMQGITHGTVKRTSPSAGALYPLEIYVLTPEGIHHYLPDGHRLELLSRDDVRARVPAQDFVASGPAIVLVTAVFARTAEKYGGNAERYVYLEAGHAAHGLMLQAGALGLGGCTVGAFDAEELSALVGLPTDHEPVYVLPIGHPA